MKRSVRFINPKKNTERQALKRCGNHWRVVREKDGQFMIEAASNPENEFRWVDRDQIEEIEVDPSYGVQAVSVQGNLVARNEPIILVILGVTFTLPAFNEILAGITSSRGSRKGQLLTGSPKKKGGLMEYIWRMVSFHAGIDMRMPITCYWYLSDWLEEQGFETRDREHPDYISVSGILNEKGEAFTRALDDLINLLCRELGMDENAAAKRWARALY